MRTVFTAVLCSNTNTILTLLTSDILLIQHHNAQFTPLVGHNKTVLSVSCLVYRCELDYCSKRVQTSNFLSATVLSCRECNSRRRSGRNIDTTVRISFKTTMVGTNKRLALPIWHLVGQMPYLPVMFSHTLGWHYDTTADRLYSTSRDMRQRSYAYR